MGVWYAKWFKNDENKQLHEDSSELEWMEKSYWEGQNSWYRVVVPVEEGEES